jgi:uncharacterized membrane protein YphA (DoxX/SURF4 family)
MSTIDLGLGLLHVATGMFFTTTGARKLFVPEVHEKVFGLFRKLGVPRPAGIAVTVGEFLGGLGLLVGCATQLAALGLVPIMVGAYLMDTWPATKAKQQPGDPWHKLLSNALCNPEAQLLVIVTTLALTGAGAYSIDGLLFN